MRIIEQNRAGNEERHVTVDGHTFVLECSEALQEWHVCWVDVPVGCHPQLGALGWRYTPGSTRTTALDVTNLDQIDSQAKEDLLRRVAIAAGLQVRDRPISRYS